MLIAAPEAREFYLHIGMPAAEGAFIYPRQYQRFIKEFKTCLSLVQLIWIFSS